LVVAPRFEPHSASVFWEQGGRPYLSSVKRRKMTVSKRSRNPNQSTKTIEAALRESEGKYKNLFEQSNDAIFVHDLDGKILDVNQKVLDLFGYAKSEILSLKVTRLHPDYALSKSQLSFETIAQTGSVNFEIDFQKKNGSIFPASVSASMFEAGGKKLIQGLVRDITRQRKSEQIQSVLFNITQATSAVESLEDLLEIIHQQLGTLIDTTNFYVALYDKETDLYSFPFVVDEFEQDDTFTPQELKKSLTDYVRRTGKALLADDNVHKELMKQGEVDLVGADSKVWMGTPLKMPEGVTGVVAVQSYRDDTVYSARDMELLSYISEHIAMAINRKRAEGKIRASLKEKDVLLKEIHHRVKNNMQIISSLIRLQSREVEDEKTRRIFDISQNRIKSIALVHETLYQSGDLSQIDFSRYIRRLTTHLLSIYCPRETALKLHLDTEEVLLDINRAIPCGLIINELVSNALKHAFPPDSPGEICVRLSEIKGVVTLIVKDCGKGFPKDVDFKTTDSLGLQIVNDLVKQLEGDIRLEQEEGTAFVITFGNTP
jgi:PAS domain S-box-containing protein